MKRSPTQSKAPPPFRPAARRALAAPAFSRALVDWFARAGRDLPWRHQPEPYAVVVSEFMLQQTQVATVLRFFPRWMARFPDWPTLASAPERVVLGMWEGLGYYSRARNLHRLAREVMEGHGGRFPSDPAEIRALPGVGDYSAGAIAAFAFNLPEPAVDANVARVLVRLLDWSAPINQPPTLRRLREVAAELIPAGNARLFNGALMELGALICTPRQPRCLLCPVRTFCRAKEPMRLPVKTPTRAVVRQVEGAWWVVREGQLALQRGEGKSMRWAGMWRLPACEPSAEGWLVEECFSYTHHQVRLRIFAGQLGDLPESVVWVPLEELAGHPMPAPHRRATSRLLEEASEVT